jgi:ATPase subunit of ABC transporter with duplicated ATPase domains
LARERYEAKYRRYADERERFETLLRERRGQAQSGGKQANRRATHALSMKVRSAERRLAHLDPVEKPWRPWELRLELPEPRRSGDLVVRLDGAVVDRGSFRLGPVDLELGWGERITVVGRNGSGKSTLLGALLGSLPLAAGRRRLGSGVNVGRLEQDRLLFAGEPPILQPFARASRLPPREARALLGRFGIRGTSVERPARSLSPGEGTRASLALLQALGVNLLVLDEPTNHLDFEAIEELERALAGYSGTVVLVTHDRRLLSSFEITRRIEVERGRVTIDR